MYHPPGKIANARKATEASSKNSSSYMNAVRRRLTDIKNEKAPKPDYKGTQK